LGLRNPGGGWPPGGPKQEGRRRKLKGFAQGGGRIRAGSGGAIFRLVQGAKGRTGCAGSAGIARPKRPERRAAGAAADYHNSQMNCFFSYYQF